MQSTMQVAKDHNYTMMVAEASTRTTAHVLVDKLGFKVSREMMADFLCDVA
jgi:hypothetical protein